MFGVLARRVGARPHGLKRSGMTDKSKSGTNDLAVRLVYLLVQAENHYIAFCHSAWREKQTSRKKFCKDNIKKKRR
ncbi:hypothetical protein [Bacillus paramycoides]|uniref:hypothetical protein n=1 Tax=Bacillus paramycoides TaxID=2026194 RepID=UPI003D0430D1